MYILELVLRWAHILGAALLAGGIAYQAFVLVPALRALGDSEAAAAARETLRKRWSILVMVATTLLLVSGLVNTARISIEYRFPNEDYNLLLAAKLILALVVFFLASVLAGRSPLAERLRQNVARWSFVLLLATLAVVGLASVMRFAERVPKDRPAASVSATPSSPARN